jgi:hypothetical protein
MCNQSCNGVETRLDICIATSLQLTHVAPRRLYNFRIDEDLDEGLKLVKEQDGIPESEQIRRALRKWLEERGVMKSAPRRALTRRKA